MTEPSRPEDFPVMTPAQWREVIDSEIERWQGVLDLLAAYDRGEWTPPDPAP